MKLVWSIEETKCKISICVLLLKKQALERIQVTSRFLSQIEFTFSDPKGGHKAILEMPFIIKNQKAVKLLLFKAKKKQS